MFIFYGNEMTRFDSFGNRFNAFDISRRHQQEHDLAFNTRGRPLLHARGRALSLVHSISALTSGLLFSSIPTEALKEHKHMQTQKASRGNRMSDDPNHAPHPNQGGRPPWGAWTTRTGWHPTGRARDGPPVRSSLVLGSSPVGPMSPGSLLLRPPVIPAPHL